MHMLSDMSAQGLIISCLFTPVTVGEEGNRDASRIRRCAHAASAAFYEWTPRHKVHMHEQTQAPPAGIPSSPHVLPPQVVIRHRARLGGATATSDAAPLSAHGVDDEEALLRERGPEGLDHRGGRRRQRAGDDVVRERKHRRQRPDATGIGGRE